MKKSTIAKAALATAGMISLGGCAFFENFWDGYSYDPQGAQDAWDRGMSSSGGASVPTGTTSGSGTYTPPSSSAGAGAGQQQTVTGYFFCTAYTRPSAGGQGDDVYYSLIGAVEIPTGGAGATWRQNDPVGDSWKDYIGTTVPGSYQATCQQRNNRYDMEQRSNQMIANWERSRRVIVPVQYLPEAAY